VIIEVECECGFCGDVECWETSEAWGWTCPDCHEEYEEDNATYDTMEEWWIDNG
jgi:hypothetical protein